MRITIMIAIIAICHNSIAQVGINTTGSDPDYSAMLDVQSTDKGMLIPRMTPSDRTNISSPATGLIVYDTDSNSFWFYNGSSWQEVGTDNLGNHLATQNLQLGSNYISGDGDSEGIVVDSDGKIGIGNNSPQDNLHVTGSIRMEDGNQQEGFVMTSDANGQASWQSFGSSLSGEVTSPDFSCLSEIGSLDLGGSFKVEYAGGYVYALQSNALKIIDVSDPANPSQTGVLSGLISTSALDVSGNIACVLDGGSSSGYGTLRVIDISDPSNPSLESTLDLPYSETQGLDVTISGNHAYVLGQDYVPWAFLMVVDISDPSNPIQGGIEGFGTYKSPEAITNDGNHLYITIGSSFSSDEMRMYSISNPGSPSLAGTYLVTSPDKIEVSGNYAYLSQSTNWQILNISNPASITLESSQSMGSFITELRIANNYLFVGTFTPNEINIYNVSDPTAPSWEAEITGNSSQPYFEVSGNYLYSRNSNSLINYQLACSGNITVDPMNGELIITPPDDLNSILSAGNDGGGNQIKNIADPTDAQDAATKSFVEANDNQNLSLVGTQLNIDNGTGVDLAPVNSDNQTLSFNSTTLSIEDGNSVDLVSLVEDSDWAINGNNMYNMNSGNIGIGETSPSGQVVIRADANDLTSNELVLKNSNTTANGTGSRLVFQGYRDTNPEHEVASIESKHQQGDLGDVVHGSDLVFKTNDGNSPYNQQGYERMRITSDGAVGIGTSDPTKGLVEIDGYLSYDIPGNIGYLNAAGNTGSYNPGAWNYSLYSSHSIACAEIHAHSDKRIKNLLEISDSRSDLSTLMQIQITNYKLHDTISKGNKIHKKVIAQQVAEVYPQAVNTGLTEVVPDIYQRADIVDGWIMLATNLKGGDRVKIIGEKSTDIFEVTQVEESRFQVAKLQSTNIENQFVFVYGREVDDFHTVDYEAISMLNVSATQEQQKIIEEQQQRISDLEAQVAKIDQLEALLHQLQQTISADKLQAKKEFSSKRY